jgi:hypothetical protein
VDEVVVGAKHAVKDLGGDERSHDESAAAPAAVAWQQQRCCGGGTAAVARVLCDDAGAAGEADTGGPEPSIEVDGVWSLWL